MKRWIKSSVSIFLLLGLSFSGFTQSSADLKKKRQKVEREIKQYEELLKNIGVQIKQTDVQAIITKKKITAREELIQAINSEILALNKEIQQQHFTIDSLQNLLNQLRDQYQKMVVNAYKNRSSTDQMVFIFSAQDFNQAYKRLKYTREIGEFRKYQAQQIKAASEVIEVKIEELEEKKTIKKSLLANKSTEKERLISEEKKLLEMQQKIKSNEKEVRKNIAKKQKESNELNQQIQKIIQEEIRKARAREQRRIDSLARLSKTVPDKKTEGYTLTPQAQQLSDNFANNKGKLPWPIKRGTISQHFGNTQHPVFRDIILLNNGINLLTNSGSSAHVVFNGTVSAVLALPNGKNAVLVQHGKYFTLYSNLDKTLVKRNENLKTGDALGIIKTDEDNKTELHFEIWLEKTTLNPEEWLKKN